MRGAESRRIHLKRPYSKSADGSDRACGSPAADRMVIPIAGPILTGLRPDAPTALGPRFQSDPRKPCLKDTHENLPDNRRSMAGTELTDANQRSEPTLKEIASVFSRYGNLTFGGGSATVAVLHGQVVERRGWITQLQFELVYALSRLTPGTNLLAFCAGVGWMVRRSMGAAVAIVAASLPCSMLAVVATHFYGLWQRNRIVAGLLRGALAAAVAIMIATAWTFARPHLKVARAKALVVVPGVLGLAFVGRFSPVRILLIAAVVGLLWPVGKGQK